MLCVECEGEDCVKLPESQSQNSGLESSVHSDSDLPSLNFIGCALVVSFTSSKYRLYFFEN